MFAIGSEHRIQGIPAVSYSNGHRVLGNSQSRLYRSFAILKVLGTGHHGRVALCDWKAPETLPPNTTLPVMQTGKGARREWASKRLVAVKQLRRVFPGGWDECQLLRELQIHREMPVHPNIIALYDFFLSADTKTLYLVLEPMEGNLQHLIKARKGRPLAGGLVASIFFQMVSGIGHMHSLNYFHRDLMPENILVSTTGLFSYRPLAASGRETEVDIVAIVKIGDFGLSRIVDSRQVYTEYVGVRWYRAPEVLLMGADYSTSLDMWSLGVIMAELLLLRPMFPGMTQLDQIDKVISVLGDPTTDYGRDSFGDPIGGGPWPDGVELCRLRGFRFPQVRPKDLHTYFSRRVPPTLIQCIGQLLRYDAEERLTALECLEHSYFRQTLPLNDIPDLSAPHLFSGTGGSYS